MNIPKIERYRKAVKAGDTRSFKEWADADLTRLREDRARRATAQQS